MLYTLREKKPDNLKYSTAKIFDIENKEKKPMNRKEAYLVKNPKDKNVFVMMKYESDSYHEHIERNIRKAFEGNEYFNPVFAKDLTPKYFSTLDDAIRNSIEMCKYGIAIFSVYKNQEVNPNVAYELGIMSEQRKDVLILKDDRIEQLFSNIVNKVWTSFNGTIDNLQQDTSELYINCKDWLSWQKQFIDDIFGFSYIEDFETKIRHEHPEGIKRLENEISRCMEKIAEYAGLKTPPHSNLRKRILHLYKQKQMTTFFFKCLNETLKTCKEYKKKKENLDSFEQEIITGYANILTRIYNDWIKSYKDFFEIKALKDKKMGV